MSKAGLIRRAVVAGAVVGGLAGYAEAIFIIRFSNLYFTAAGKIGLMVAAAVIYAAYGMVAAAILSGLWRFFGYRRSGRAAVSAAALSFALIYSLQILLSFVVLSRSSLLSARFFLWASGLLAASLLAAYLAGPTVEFFMKRRRVIVLLACAAIALGAWQFFPRGGEARPAGDMPSVVLVTIDTIRADRLNCYGHERIKTPTLDRLASEGVLFENAICQIPITNPSHLSILSSQYPHQTGVLDNGQRRPPGLSTVVDEFKKRGYDTAAFVSSFTLDSRFGFAEGFDIYDDDSSWIKGCQGLSLVRIAEAVLRGLGCRLFLSMALERDAGRTNDEVFSWLMRGAESPFFLWVHYFDPHGPYTPPAQYTGMYYRGVRDDPNNRSLDGIELPGWVVEMEDFTDIGYPIAQYDAEITYTDAELGRLLEELNGRIGDYILVVAGDHGENLTEHGEYFTHGDHLYEEQVRVPLIVRRKGHIEPAVASSVVENIDIAPTILEMAGIEVPDWCRGSSLVPVMKGEARREREGALSVTGLRKNDGTIDVAYRTDRHRLIVKPGEGVELYDIEKDPNELRDISGEREDLVKEYGERVRSVLGDQVGEASAIMDYETRERLKSLGYIQ